MGLQVVVSSLVLEHYIAITVIPKILLFLRSALPLLLSLWKGLGVALHVCLGRCGLRSGPAEPWVAVK